MSKKARIAVIILAIISLLLAITALFMFCDGFSDPNEVVTKKGFDREKADSMIAQDTEEPSDSGQPDPSPPAKRYDCPVDFAALKKVNPDIYAWIDIPDTVISYPLLQRKGEDRYYLNHNSDGNYSIEGALFTESYYNRTRFNDPMTVVYGHFMSDGSLFGSLQRYYSDKDFFAKHNIVRIYLEDEMHEYKIFAAVPYSNAHLLCYYNFASPRVFDAFFDDVFSVRDVSATFDKDAAPECGQKILTLSTCLWGNNRQRFLVFAAELNADK